MSKEILEVESEEIGNPLEQVIEKTLVKNNVTDKVIQSLREQYGGLKLKSVEDKESYLIIKDARKNVRSVGILAEKLCKAGREEAIAVQKLWLSKEKEVLAKIAEVQDPLDAELRKFEDELERKQKEEEERKERLFMERQTTLLKMEARFENNSFVLGGISYEISNIREADAEVWSDTILPKYQREYEKIEQAKAEEERNKFEEAEKLRLEKEKFEQEQAEFRKQQEEFQKQQAELQRLKDEAEKAERDRLSDLVSKRAGVLRGLGMAYDGTRYDYADIYISKDQVVSLDENGWSSLVSETTLKIKEAKELEAKIAEEKRVAELEAARQQAIKDEQDRIEREKEEERVRLEQASDKDKWAAFVASIPDTTPEFKSNIYKAKATSVKALLTQIKSI